MKFDDSCMFTEEEKEDLEKMMEKYNASREIIQWGKYKIYANPTTEIVFTNSKLSYYDELQNIQDILRLKFPNEDDLGIAAYLSQGYSKEEFLQDTSHQNFMSMLSNVVDMIMGDRLCELLDEREM